MIQLSPSVLSADFTKLGEQIREAEAAGVNRFHIDVMDGLFVPNISMGPFVVEAIRSVTTLPLEAHLMIEAPERHVDAFIKAGADVIIVHQENTPHLHRLLQHIREQGKQAGVALNPGTPIDTLDIVLDSSDLILVMSVNPGFSGQNFIPATLPKMRRVRELITARGLACDLEVDGGVNAETAPKIVAAGVNVLVAATAIYKHPNGIAGGVQELRKAAEARTRLI